MSGPRRAEDRLRRLLVMLPWLMEVGEVPLADLATRFDMTEAAVQKELELVAMCGLPPFVDEMIDLFVDDGMVFVGVPRLFTRPLRLTAPEGFALLTSARAAMELPGADPEGPLGRGLAKLTAALGDTGLAAAPGSPATDQSDVVIDMERPPLAAVLTEAAASGSEMRMRYYTPSRDEVAERLFVPRHVFVDAGHWYVLADDDRSGEQRTFRIDRMDDLASTGRTVPAAGPVNVPDEFFIDADVPRAVLRLAPRAHWVADVYPTDQVEELEHPAGWIEVRMPVSSERWLGRLLVRLGSDAIVVEPRNATDVAAELARLVLARYET